jgi:hypothetical protein
MGGKLGAAAGALIFGFFAVLALRTGRVPEKRSFTGPQLYRRDHPIRFWVYAVSMLLGAVICSYIAVFAL